MLSSDVVRSREVRSAFSQPGNQLLFSGPPQRVEILLSLTTGASDSLIACVSQVVRASEGRLLTNYCSCLSVMRRPVNVLCPLCSTRARIPAR